MCLNPNYGCEIQTQLKRLLKSWYVISKFYLRTYADLHLLNCVETRKLRPAKKINVFFWGGVKIIGFQHFKVFRLLDGFTGPLLPTF